MSEKPPCLLLVHGDPALRGSLAEQVATQTGWDVVCADSAVQALALADERVIDLVLTDGTAGAVADLRTSLSQRGSGAAVVSVVGDEEEAARIGADAAVTRPFRLGTLITCLRDCLARSRRGEGGGLVLGGLRFLADARALVNAVGVTIRLTEKEAAMLAFLHRASGRVVGRDELLTAVWGYQRARLTTHTVETHVYQLRRKLEAGAGEGTGARLLLTEPGGYRLVP